MMIEKGVTFEFDRERHRVASFSQHRKTVNNALFTLYSSIYSDFFTRRNVYDDAHRLKRCSQSKKKNVLYAIGNDFVFYFLAFFAFTPRFEFRVWYDKMEKRKKQSVHGISIQCK